MIFTQQQLRYLAELPATVARAVPKAPNPDVPYLLADPVVRNYELLRSVWMENQPIVAACRHWRVGKQSYYELERGFLEYGLPAVYPKIVAGKQNAQLERLALLVKTTRPKATEAMILRFAEALGMAPCPSLRMIGHVLHCHGIGNTRDKEDRAYWHEIQESVRALQRMKTGNSAVRTKRDRKGTFYQPEENLQVRFELFRELSMGRRKKVGDVVRRYGLSRPTFYKYLRRFRRIAFWGLVDWVQPGHGRVRLSGNLEIQILEEKLEHPRLTLDELARRLRLKCAYSSVYELLKYWGLLDKHRAPVRLRGFWGEAQKEEKPTLLTTAKAAAEAGKFDPAKKVNAHFSKLLLRLKSRAYRICDPGPIILAQFIDDMGVCEALRMYGPKREKGCEITNLILLNVCRILAGYETIGQLGKNADRSVAIAAGVGIFPGKTALYEGLGDLKFEHLQALRNDLTARARDLAFIRGKRLAQDFHFKEFYGAQPDAEAIGKGPNAAGDVCAGFRPHVIWDLDTDVLVNIAFCNGSTRATTAVRAFCEKNLYPVLDRETIREIYLDSEYTSFPVVT